MSKKRDRRRTARASTGLTQRKTGPPSLGGELPEKVTDSNDDLAKFQQTFATTDPDLAVVLAIQAASSLGDPITSDRGIHKVTRAAVASVGARDGLEALLAVQIVATHNLAMKFLASADPRGCGAVHKLCQSAAANLHCASGSAQDVSEQGRAESSRRTRAHSSRRPSHRRSRKPDE
jgi:hypothetical protein